MKKYEYLEHPADLKIHVVGDCLSDLFANAVLAMMNFLYVLDAKRHDKQYETIHVEGENLESLFVNWLAEILCLSDTKTRAYVDIKINHLTETSISAQIGSVLAAKKDDIKAVTYSDLSIKKINKTWDAVFVCDI